MSKRDEQLARMKGLMTYGTTNVSKKTPVTESIEGPDGNVYAIIREGAKYYIKSTPKGSELVKESFDYIGGFMNKKANEFASYNQASKNLELKVRSLNEAYGVNATVEMLNPEKKESLMVEMTDAMKASLARYRQIMNNAAGIMNESSNISASNTGVPEAPKTTSFSPKLGEPFTTNAEATLDTDLKATAGEPEKQGEPFGDNEKVEEYKDAQYVPDGSIANKKPSGGKVVRVNENEEYEETLEECDEWGSCGLPASEGTGEVGDDEPFVEPIHESEADDFAGVPMTNENEEEVEMDIDLDDIDTDLDSDETEDLDIDDIDTEEDLDDEVDPEEDVVDDEPESNDEIETLKAEIAELRSLIDELRAENLKDDDAEFDDEDEDEDEEMYQESFYHNAPLLEGRIRTDFLSDPRHRYYIGTMLANMANENNANERDMRLINNIKGRLMEILQCETEINEYKRMENYDDETWDELLTSMENDINQMSSMINQISFINNVDRTTLDRRVNKIVSKYDELREFYEANVDPDTANGAMNQTPAGFEDDEDAPEIEEYNDNEGFEDDNMSDDDIDAQAWANAEDFDYRNLDLSSVTPRRINENGTRLNVFGKHPGYRSKVMTLPKTGSDHEGNYRDWNDESVYSEEPWGTQIGDSAPFTDIVKQTVDSIMESLKKKL